MSSDEPIVLDVREYNRREESDRTRDWLLYGAFLIACGALGLALGAEARAKRLQQQLTIYGGL